MALPADAVFEIRPGGSNNNGGAFKSGGTGTDFSKQDAAQVAIDGATITAVVHSTTTQITLTGYTVSAADKDNFTNFNGGTGTTGRYHITAVDVVNNRWTLDRSAGTAAQTLTGFMGGGFATPQQFFTSCVTYSGTLGNVGWIKGGTAYVQTGTINVGSQLGWSLFGYTTTRGDGGVATITTATNSTTLFTFTTSSSRHVMRNLLLTNTAGTRAPCWDSTAANLFGFYLDRVVMDGFSTSLVDTANIWEGTWLHCQVKNCTGVGLQLTRHNDWNDNSFWLFACRFNNNGSHGLYIKNANSYRRLFAENCVMVDNAGKGIYIDAEGASGNNPSIGIFVNRCTLANNTSSGLEWVASSANERALWITNTIMYGNGSYGVNFNTTTGFVTTYAENNAYGSNNGGGTGLDRNGFPASPDYSPDKTLTVNPFTNSATGDYTLNNTTGGGAECRGSGSPSTIP